MAIHAAFLSCCNRMVLTVQSVDEIPVKVWPIIWKLLTSAYFPAVPFVCSCMMLEIGRKKYRLAGRAMRSLARSRSPIFFPRYSPLSSLFIGKKFSNIFFHLRRSWFNDSYRFCWIITLGQCRLMTTLVRHLKITDGPCESVCNGHWRAFKVKEATKPTKLNNFIK